jgi:Tfp pilus assembly protein PilX
VSHVRLRQSQQGATLLVSLIMLVVITMFAVTGINLSSVNLRIVGNAQIQRQLEAAVQEAIEQAITNPTLFSTTATAQVATIDGIDVTVSAPQCKYFTIAEGVTRTRRNIAPQYTYWDFNASATDALSGAEVTIHQGVKIPLPAGNCV